MIFPIDIPICSERVGIALINLSTFLKNLINPSINPLIKLNVITPFFFSI